MMKHPLAQFLYCPECGSPHFEVNNEKSKKCTDCGFVYYFNPSSATVALILNEKKELLVCRRAKEPAKGTLDLPGGFIDMNETGEEGPPPTWKNRWRRGTCTSSPPMRERTAATCPSSRKAPASSICRKSTFCPASKAYTSEAFCSATLSATSGASIRNRARCA